jgi:flagellum-specific peptidoglycan hydrolase FlgJ
MATPEQLAFLLKAFNGAQAAQHVYPAMAACEAALESAWGTSELAIRANNLFGQKQATHPIYGTLVLPTKEFINSEWVTEDAYWVTFPLLADCFTARMDTLERLAPEYPHYALALEAKTAEEYVTEVSLSWSTDPDRAQNCIEIYHAHLSVFATT